MKKRLYFFSIFLILISIFQISNVSAIDSLSIYQSNNKFEEFSHNVAFDSFREKQRIAQFNFQLPYNIQNQNLSLLFPNIYLNNHSYYVKRVLDESIINPSFPAYYSQALEINISNPSIFYARLQQQFSNKINVQNASMFMVFSGNAHTFSFYLLDTLVAKIGIIGDLTTQQLFIYYDIGGTFTQTTVLNKFLPLSNTFQRGYIQFTNLNNQLNINWIAANSTTWISDNYTTINYNAASINAQFNQIFIDISTDFMQPMYIYAIDSNVKLSHYAYNFKTSLRYSATTQFYSKIDSDYYTNKTTQFSNFINNSVANISYPSYVDNSTNESIEFYNWGIYQNYWTNSHYVIRDYNVMNENLVRNYKNGFRFETQLRMMNYTAIMFEFLNDNFTITPDIDAIGFPIEIVRDKTTNMSIYHNSNKLGTVNCSFLPNEFNFREFSLVVEFYNKNLRISLLGNDSYYNFYSFCNSELKNISFWALPLFNTTIHLKSLNFTKLNSEISYYQNKSKMDENQMYPSLFYNDNYATYIFTDSVTFEPIIDNPYALEISINNTDFYFNRNRIAYVKMIAQKNTTQGYHRIEESGKIYPVFQYIGQQYEQLEFFNDYNGFSNSSFIDKNGGTFDFITTLISPTITTFYMNLTISIVYEFEYLTNPAIEFYFEKGLQILLPLSILGIFTLGLYSKSKSKYFAAFGFIIGILVLYLIGMISLLLFIFMLFVTIFGFYIIIKHERSDL